MPSATPKTTQDQTRLLLRELCDNFLLELPDRLDNIESTILKLEKGQSDIHEENAAFNKLYRYIHSLKGSAGTHGIPIVSHICHQFEDMLTKMGSQQNVTPCLIDAFLQFTDLMRHAIKLASDEDADYSNIYEELETIRNHNTQGQFTALIVEESSFMANLYVNSLSTLPIDITMVKDGLEALQRLLREKYDILIMSVETKTLNGKALLYALRAADGTNHDIQTILITSRKDITFAKDMAPNTVLRKNQTLSQQLHDAAATSIQT